MKPAGVEEPATRTVAPQKLIEVRHRGKLIGYFLPLPPDWDPSDGETRRAVEKLGEAVARAHQVSRIKEEGFVLALTGAGAPEQAPKPSTQQAPPPMESLELHPAVRATMGVFRLKTSEPVSIEQIMDEGREYWAERALHDETEDDGSGDAGG